jgi:GH15 family glucan-1,4-alpha-glucosidase
MSPAISDYGLIGNCQTAALVSKAGSIDWCCLPRFDSESFFAKILDEALGGSFSISPMGSFTSRQQYQQNTNILETSFINSSGKSKLSDFFSVTSEKQKKNRFWPSHEILRIIEVTEGRQNFDFIFHPKMAYGKKTLALRKIGRWGIEALHGKSLLTLQGSCGNQNLKIIDGTKAEASFSLSKGEKLVFSLAFTRESPAILPPLSQALERLDLTKKYWQDWLKGCQYHGSYEEQVKRSALTLKLLTFAPSGAVVAAPTTSLPEVLGGERNWDYRYCWLRDSAFTMRALVSLGFFDEAKAFMSWLLHSTKLTRPELQVVYSVYGESNIKEKVLDWLGGFAASKPVRIGNAASKQMQLDVYGEVIDAFYELSPYLKKIDQETKNLLLQSGQAVLKHWRDADEGIWEVRSGKAQHTHSKVLCWSALTKLTAIAKKYNWQVNSNWQSEAELIRETIEAQGYSVGLQAYVRSFETNELDASLLVLPLVNYCSASNERFLNTTKAIQAKLSKNGLVFRYQTGSDGLSGKEGAFGICNFWLSEVLAKAGKLKEANFWFCEILKRGTDLGLFPEEFDAGSEIFLGNFPQAFTHIGLINAALTIDKESKKRSSA